MCLLVDLAMPTIMAGAPRDTLATETTNAMARFTWGATQDGMVRVLIALALVADSGFNL